VLVWAESAWLRQAYRDFVLAARVDIALEVEAAHDNSAAQDSRDKLSYCEKFRMIGRCVVGYPRQSNLGNSC
jgi:hypothetical protein